MVEKTVYDNLFHRWYVGGKGDIAEPKVTRTAEPTYGQSYDEILAEYRAYVHDPQAELPVEVLDQLRQAGKI